MSSSMEPDEERGNIRRRRSQPDELEDHSDLEARLHNEEAGGGGEEFRYTTRYRNNPSSLPFWELSPDEVPFEGYTRDGNVRGAEPHPEESHRAGGSDPTALAKAYLSHFQGDYDRSRLEKGASMGSELLEACGEGCDL